MALITIQQFTLPCENLADGNGYTLRCWYNQGFLDSSGQAVAPGTSTTGTQLRSPATVAGGFITFDPFTVYSTLDAESPNPRSIQIACQLFKGNTALPVKPFQQLGTSATWIVPQDLGSTISFEEWTIANQAQQLYYWQPNWYTQAQVDALIRANNTQVAFNQDYVITQYASLAAAVAAAEITDGTLVINESTACPDDLTVPANVTLRFTRKGSIVMTSLKTLTILGPLEADPVKIFFNANDGEGLVSFEGSTALPMIIPQWWGALADRTTSAAGNNDFIQRAIDSIATTGGAIYISFGMKWLISGVTVPDYFTIYDYSGYLNLDDPTFNGGFTQGPRIYLMEDQVNPPVNNAGDEFNILSPFHPGLIIDNISASTGGDDGRASIVFRQDGVSKWQVGKTEGAHTADEHFHITSYIIDPGGTPVFVLDQFTGAMALNTGAADTNSTLDLNSRTGKFIGLFSSEATDESVEFGFVRGPTDSTSFRMFTLVGNNEDSSFSIMRGDSPTNTMARFFRMGSINLTTFNTSVIPPGLTDAAGYFAGGVGIGNGFSLKWIDVAGNSQISALAVGGADTIIIDPEGRGLFAGTPSRQITNTNGSLRAVALDNGAWAIPGAIGGTTPAAGKFTTLEGTTSLTVGSGTALTKVLKGTVTIDPASINATTFSSQTFALSGAVVGDTLILNPPAAGLTSGVLVGQVFVSAGDTITIVFYNTTAGPIDLASASWNYTLIR